MSTNDPAALLLTAVYEGDGDAVVRLLRSGASPESADTDGETALYLAAVSDRPDVVRLLLVAGADPDRLSQGTDAPLCGAACGGHTTVVRALLAAGADPDRVEGFGFTALTWAVQRGKAAVVTELLAAGADPDRPGPTGEPPLVAAARRGSPGCVRALLRRGARDRSAALAEAHRWLTVDVEAALRASLERTHGPGHPSVVHRHQEDGGVTVEVQLLGRDGHPVSGDDQQTGHAAVVTLLETSLGITAPAAELAARALRHADPADDDWGEAATALGLRADEDTFRAAVLWCRGTDPLRQAFGADVLGRSGAPRGRQVLRELARETRHPVVARAAVVALGRREDPAALPEVLHHAGHPEAAVRAAVADALAALLPAGHSEGLERLRALAEDHDAEVRARAADALTALGARG
ncbi:ankyrin repeat domain-containing protein [Streptomyces sp. NPDC096934]|uniref:ankyrin repeat domain-containing protein n=1 Tax=Streptomyces sp. NPDC096934 TaxID=3155551 RepID=UPI003318DA1E